MTFGSVKGGECSLDKVRCVECGECALQWWIQGWFVGLRRTPLFLILNFEIAGYITDPNLNYKGGRDTIIYFKEGSCNTYSINKKNMHGT